MFDRDSWLEIANTVLSNPLRTGLTGLSIALGIFILVVMQGLGTGLENGVQSTFGNRVSNLIEIRTGRTQLAYRGRKPNRQVQMHNADENALKDSWIPFPLGRVFFSFGAALSNFRMNKAPMDCEEWIRIKKTLPRLISLQADSSMPGIWMKSARSQ